MKNDDAGQVIVITEEDPRSGTSLVPMLIAGLVLIVVGMIAVLAMV